MNGLIVLYVNVENSEMDINDYLNIMKVVNAPLIEGLASDGYGTMFVPVRNESSRVEKVDFDLPFPRYLLPHIDLVEHEKTIQEIKEKTIDQAVQGIKGDDE